MARRIYRFETPDRFVAGALGPAGQRTFYLQARAGGELVSVVLEKVQVAALASRLIELVAEIRRRGVGVPAGGAPAGDADPLAEPLTPAFRVATLRMSWDGETAGVTIEALAGGEDEASDDAPVEYADDDPSGPDLLRVRLGAAEAEAFSRRAERVVAAGRPACPMCGQPLDPLGHLCPRRNGHGPYLN